MALQNQKGWLPIRDLLFNLTARTRICNRREKGLHACVDFACGDPSTNLIPTPIEAGSEAARGEVARGERSGQRGDEERRVVLRPVKTASLEKGRCGTRMETNTPLNNS